MDSFLFQCKKKQKNKKQMTALDNGVRRYSRRIPRTLSHLFGRGLIFTTKTLEEGQHKDLCFLG